MKLLIKQKVFSWTDSFNVYDDHHEKKYTVKAELISWGHKIHIYDAKKHEIGMVKEKKLTFMPTFEIELNGKDVGKVHRKMSFAKAKYELEPNDWVADGDFLGWDYDIRRGFHKIADVNKKLLSWGDTYELDIKKPEDELLALMLVIAIDAANCDCK